MVKKVTKPKVSAEEKKYRKHLFPEVSSIQNKNILCTSCNTSVKELVLRGRPIAHRFLDTLLCEKCDEFFGDGEFSVDEDGSDKYCRWCGQGGTLYLCCTCTAGFCKKCIKRNLPRSALNEVEDDNWKCYCCDVKPLYDLRALCWAAQKYATENVKVTDNSRKKKVKRRSSSDEEREEKSEQPDRKKRNTRHSRKENPENTIEKHIEKHIQVGALKMSEFLSDTVSLVEIVKKKGLEYKNKKSVAKSLNTVDSIISCANKVDSVLEHVENSTKKMRENLSNYIEAWKRAIEEDETFSSERSKEGDDETMVTAEDSDNGNDRRSKSGEEPENEKEKRTEKDSEIEDSSRDKGDDKGSEGDSKDRSSNHDSDEETKIKSIEHDTEEESKDRDSNDDEAENEHDKDRSKVDDSDSASEREDIDAKANSKKNKSKGEMDNGDTNDYRRSADDEET